MATNWVYNATSPGRFQVRSTKSVQQVYDIRFRQTSNPKTWNANKTYLFETNVLEFYATAASFSIQTNWGDKLGYNAVLGTTPSGSAPTTGTTQSLYLYSSPPSTTTNTLFATWQANAAFGTNTTAPWNTNSEGIRNFNIHELDFKVQGFSYYKVRGTELQISNENSIGWHYEKSSDIYFWYDRVAGTPSTIAQANRYGLQPVGGPNNGKRADVGYRLNNYMAKFVPYSLFNLYFNYQNQSNFPLKIYLSPNLPSSNPASLTELETGTYSLPSSTLLIATLTQSASASQFATSHAFYGLRGNQYLYFVGPYVGLTSSSSTYSTVYISDIIIDGGYHSGNNRQYLTTNSGTYSNPTQIIPIGLTGATFSAFVGTGNTVNATSSLSLSVINAKMGNGTFRAGIWENGVWNSGWRVDENMYEFHSIGLFFGYIRLKRWRIEVVGPEESVSQFEIGDNVSIGNIVAIDINEERKLIKGYFTIINKTDTSIIVEFDNDFPLRRVARDSDNHRIYITKNVWLSGGFLNGYFKGVWNYGLFKGYPLITEMYDSHWIDGVFDGGHFSTTKYTVPNFTDTVYSSGKVGLTFSSPHGLAINDTITIDKNNKDINPQYDGQTTVTEIVNEYQIVTDLDWGSDSTLESGSVEIDMSKGLVQRIDFKSNNRSKITTSQSIESESIFLYDSWMDVNYFDTSAVNIGKPQTIISQTARSLEGRRQTSSENNLYGYPTKDILESTSNFRDSFSTTVRKYRLGTKYKIFADYIGDAGNFQEYFGPTGPDAQLFLDKGWTYSGYVTFSRTEDLGIEGLSGEELRVQAALSGGVLNITPDSNEEILNRTNERIERNRYTKIEFDLITFSNDISVIQNYYEKEYTFSLKYTDLPNSLDYKSIANYGFYSLPALHFNNINKIRRDVFYSVGGGITASTLIDASFLPIYKNIDHLQTKPQRKIEYFFNKRNLSMVFQGLGYYSAYSNVPNYIEYIIDNLHFYEVDMIPFFQYFIDENINRGIQVPYQGLSPFIDYSNANFNFIDNISIGLDSIQTQNSFSVVSGVGVGIASSVASSAGGGVMYVEYGGSLGGRAT